MLLGRLAELGACQAALSVDGGPGAAAVVIAGPAGIGKTSLWRAVADAQPAGAVVVRTTGISGGQAGLANLADLLDPVAGMVLPALPQAQASALKAAVGQAVAETPLAETLLERAVVGALRHLAGAGLVMAVDDEQWLDADTRRLLESAAVRLNGAPVRWLVSVRAEHADRGLAGVLAHELGARTTRVDLAGLQDDALSELVLDRFPQRWSPGVLRQVVALAAGSPYAALEVARETVARGGHDGTAAHLPSTLSGSLRSHLERLRPPTLAIVQAAALAGAPTRVLLRTVAGGPVGEQVDEALEAGVLEAAAPDPVLWFSHPLLRETAEGMLTSPARRRLHRLIGAALDDLDEAAWHLARGADEPDEALAERLDRAAHDASARGATVRAAALAQMAAELTPVPDSLQGWRRRISWLERLEVAGEFEQVRQLSEKWATNVPVSLRGRLTAVQADVETDVEAICRMYAEAFEDLAGRDPARAAEAGTQMCILLGIVLRRLEEARSRTAAVIEQARAAGNPVLLRNALAAAGILAALAGEPDAGDQLREAVWLPGFTDTPLVYDSPETVLAMWLLWRGELGPVGAENLCHQAVFMNHASGAVAALDPELIEVGDAIGQRAQRRGLLQGAVRLVGVAGGLVVAQDDHQMPLVPYQGPVQQLAPAAAGPAFHDRVHPWRLDGGADDPDARGLEDRAGRGGEAGVPVMNHELHPRLRVLQVHEQVPGLLDDPRLDRVPGGTQDPDPAGAMLDYGKDIGLRAVEQAGGEEIQRQDPLRLGPQELRPARSIPARSGVNPGALKDLPHRRRSNRYSQSGQLAVDPPVPPGLVLPGQPQHHRPDLPLRGRAPGPAPA